jgi:hypothetical protein
MTFSLRLTADLTRALAARAILSHQSYAPIQQLSPDTNIETAFLSRSPILWVAGPEALDFADIAGLANALETSRRTVFLETSGVSLKRRLHEFRPSSRFYFAVRFENAGQAVDQSSAGEIALRTGIEALRMARLAGFFACAHFAVRSGATVPQLEDLHAKISKLGVDGFLVTAAVLSPEAEKTAKLVRRRLLGWRWALLSSLVESTALPGASRTPLDIDRQPVSESQQDSLGESVEAG